MIKHRFISWGTISFLLLCMVLGGSSARGSGAIGNGIIQSSAVALIILLLWSRGALRFSQPAKSLSWLIALFVLYVLLSLVPLPPDIWQALPGREPIANGYRLLGIEAPSVPLSLSSQHSLASLLWLLPPTAIFLATQAASTRQRVRLAWTVVGIAVVSTALGVAQLLGGEDSGLRFYQITNRGSPVGFFANTNHLTTLLLCTMPLCAYVAARAVRRAPRQSQRNSSLLVAAGLSLLLLSGVLATGSSAGLGLLIPAGLSAFLIYRRGVSGRLNRIWFVALGGLCLLFIGLAVAGPLGQEALSDELTARPASRASLAATTARASYAFLPLGSGLGTFQEVYRTFDDPNRSTREYANHAHNDYVEVALELGVPGILLVMGFVLWWLRRAVAAWGSDLDGAGLARAGSVIIFVILMHSIVDYPVRTTAIAVMLALACGYLTPPVAAAPVARKGARASSRTPDRPKHVEVD